MFVMFPLMPRKKELCMILQHTSVLANIVFEDESLQRYQGILAGKRT